MVITEIRGKISKQGNSYFLRIPKDLVDCKIFSLGEEITAFVKANQNLNKDTEFSHTHMPLTLNLVRAAHIVYGDHINSVDNIRGELV